MTVSQEGRQDPVYTHSCPSCGTSIKQYGTLNTVLFVLGPPLGVAASIATGNFKAFDDGLLGGLVVTAVVLGAWGYGLFRMAKLAQLRRFPVAS